MLKICPRCNTRFMVAERTNDYIHECNSGNLTRDQEDILRIGPFVDYTGSNATSDPYGREVMWQGIAKKNFGMRSDIEGEDTERRTRRGKNTELYRTRQRLQYIDLKK